MSAFRGPTQAEMNAEERRKRTFEEIARGRELLATKSPPRLDEPERPVTVPATLDGLFAEAERFVTEHSAYPSANGLEINRAVLIIQGLLDHYESE